MYTLENKQSRVYLTFNGEYVFDYRENKKFAIKHCKEYAVVYPLHIRKDDDYEYHPHDGTEIYCDFFKEGEYLYSLRRNNYYPSEKFFIEFFVRTIDDKIVFIFNKEHGVIDICDPENGKTLHTTKPDDIFIKSHKVLDDGKHMFFQGWYWSPLYFNAIYDIQKLITEQDYEPTIIEYKGKTTPDFSPDGNMISSNLLEKSYTPEYVLEHHDDIHKESRDLYVVKKFNKNRKNESILREISKIITGELHDPTVIVTFNENNEKNIERTFPSTLLDNDVLTLNISCTGKVSGDDLSARYFLSLITKFDTKFDTKSETYAFNARIIKQFTCGFNKGLPISNFSMHFCFTYVTEKDGNVYKFYLDVDQDLEKDENFDGRYKVSENLPTRITIGPA